MDEKKYKDRVALIDDMGNSVSFFDNYMAAADILTIFVCIVIYILMTVSYIKREQNFIVFRRIPMMIILSAQADLLFNLVFLPDDRRVTPGSYITYFLYYFSLFMALFLFMSYIRATMWRENFRWEKIRYVVWMTISLSIAVMAALPFITGGVFSQYQPFVYTALYTVNLVILIFMIYHSRGYIYGRILAGVCGSTGLAVILMYAQLFFRQTSYTSATFLFPLVALLYLMHSNPYDFALGAVDSDAFEDLIKYNYSLGKDLYLMSLYLRELDLAGGIMPTEVRQRVRYYGEKFIRGSQLFKISDGHMILVLDTARNPRCEEQADEMLTAFYDEYKNFGLDYKIVFMRSIKEISAKNEYIPMIQFFHARMEDNQVLRVAEKDIEEYNKFGYILDQLRDIGAKKDMNDPRVLVYCQPVLNTRTGYYDTAEALMRLKLPKAGMVFPDQFIPLAEKYGMIHTLSLIILTKTCAEIKSLLSEGYNVKRISVNFSMIDVRDPAFAQQVKSIVSIIGIPFEKIAIEITESQNEKDFLVVKEKLNELKDSGIKFYLDDFGTGYSSFERIMELPFDIIKFDRSLTVASGSDVKVETMVSYLAHMFTDMNYSVLYEGIEDNEDEDRCVRMFARYLQGYKYSKPIPIEKLRDYFVKTTVDQSLSNMSRV